jgi:hypothetical protein
MAEGIPPGSKVDRFRAVRLGETVVSVFEAGREFLSENNRAPSLRPDRGTASVRGLTPSGPLRG